MQPKSGLHRRLLKLETLEQRIALSAQSWDLAADLAANYAAGFPQNNPNGVWTYLGTDGTPGSLVATSATAGLGAGWAEPTINQVPSYVRAATHAPFHFPAGTMSGHGPNHIIWTAPEDADLGGVEVSGLLTEFEHPLTADRQVRLRLFKNDSVDPFVDIESIFNNKTAIVDMPATQVAIAPGDTISIVVDGSGSQGSGTANHASWNVVITEYQLPGDYNLDSKVDQHDYDEWKLTFGQTVAAGDNADGNGNGVIDMADYNVWLGNLGAALDSGVTTTEYHPAAVIVQTSGVTLPDGTQLDLSATQTSGLQEAIDFATNGGWDVFVLPGTYLLDSHIDIEESRIRSFRWEDATLNFSSAVTDYGIRFDSTMMIDWYWKGGALNAPSATHGVLFEPRSLHPLDGELFGTSGVVDSRFLFNVDINAGTHKVTMDSEQATINEAYFHFKNVLDSEINYVGGGFSTTNVFQDARTDDPIPYDLFSTAGRVTVIPPVGEIGAGLDGIATVYLPDGSRLYTTGTTTSGLQEAFDYASANSLDVVVFARGTLNVDPFSNVGLYNLGSGLTIGSLDARSYHIYSVTFNYTPSVGAALTLTDVVNSSSFELTGQVVAQFAPIDVLIKPISVGVLDSTIRIQHVPVSYAANSVGVLIDPSMQSVENNAFYFNEVLAGDFGITVANPSATTYFRNNFLSSLHTHDSTVVGVQVGQSATNADRITQNEFEIRTNTDGSPTEVALQVWGADNTLDLISINAGLNIGAKFEPGSQNNTLLAGVIQATMPVLDFGTNNQVIQNGASTSLAFRVGIPILEESSTKHTTTKMKTSGTLAATQGGGFGEEERVELALLSSLANPSSEQTAHESESDLNRQKAFSDLNSERDVLSTGRWAGVSVEEEIERSV